MAEINNETSSRILQAAEDEFIEKGYGNAKMMSIAARAGVSHSMLHYYFRSKENMFQMVFQEKTKVISSIFEGLQGKLDSFEDVVRTLVEKQYDLMHENPRLPLFLINEIVANGENLKMVLNAVKPTLTPYILWFETILKSEILAGKIRNIGFRDFIINVIAINAATFISIPVNKKIIPDFDEQAFIEGRKKSNADFILASLRP